MPPLVAHPTARLVTSAALILGAAVGASAGAAQQLEQGRELYVQHCVQCHGAEGRGDGEMARRLGFLPRDFGLGAFKCRSTPSGSPPTREDLVRTIGQGMPGTPMTGMSRKVDAEGLEALAAYIETLIPRIDDPDRSKTLFIPEPPQPSAESIAEGRAVYVVLRCWACHGIDGRGKGPSAEGLTDTWGERMRVYDFTRGRRFKCGGEDRDLYRTLHTGFTGSPMPSFTAAFAFASDRVSDLGELAESLSPEVVDATREWLASQPATSGLATADDRQELVERRTWALVHYLRSLAAK